MDSKKQYMIDNADKIKERNKQYSIDNADKIKARMKQYNIDNADKIKARDKSNIKMVVCECGMELQNVKLKQHHSRNIHAVRMEELNLYGRVLTTAERNKTRCKSEVNVLKKKEQQHKYYQANKDKIDEKAKQYRIENADVLKVKKLCECGRLLTEPTRSRHLQTQFHINYINIKSINSVIENEKA